MKTNAVSLSGHVPANRKKHFNESVIKAKTFQVRRNSRQNGANMKTWVQGAGTVNMK